MIWDLKLPLAELKRRDRVRGTGVLLDPVYTISGKFLNGQKLTRIDLSLTRDLRNLASFWKANSTVICYRICGVPYKMVAQVKIRPFRLDPCKPARSYFQNWTQATFANFLLSCDFGKFRKFAKGFPGLPVWPLRFGFNFFLLTKFSSELVFFFFAG